MRKNRGGVTEERLDRRLLTQWRLGAVVPALVWLVTWLALALSVERQGGLVGAGGLASAAVIAAVGQVVATVRWRSWRYQLGEDALELRFGVVRRVHSSVPYFRVQRIDVVAGPVDRFFDLARLVLHTASASTDATIPGIDAARVDDVRRRILDRVGEGDSV